MRYSLIFTGLLVLLLFNCNPEIKNGISLSGTIINNSEAIMKISNLDNSSKKEIPISADGSFATIIETEDGGPWSIQIGRQFTTLFLEPGNEIDINIDSEEFFNSIAFSGSGSELNNYVQERNRLKKILVGDAKEFFVVSVDEFLNKINENKKRFLSQLEKANLPPQEKALQEKMIQHDFLYTRNNYKRFVQYHTKKEPELPSNFYDPLLSMNIDDIESFHWDSNYRHLLIENWKQDAFNSMKLDTSIDIIDFTKSKISTINNPEIRDHMAGMLRREINSKNKNVDEDYKRILKLYTGQAQKDKLAVKYESLKNESSNRTSVGFNYENYDGGKTSLKELEGRYKYIEIWATWCGPCIKEFPSLKQLIIDYKDSPITFVSIATDNPRDKEKWRKIVEESDVGGIQLFADNGLESEFMKNYQVNLLPRTIILDPEGKIINQSAPRPSSSEIRTLLDKLLKSKTLRSQ